MTTDLINTALHIAPAPTSPEGANRVTWVKHYAAQALAAYATFRAEIRTLPRNPEPGSRPDLGYLMLIATSATAAAAALTDQTGYAPTLIWDLTPEAGALNGEWEEWLADVLVRRGINPGHIDPDLDAADFTEAVRTLGPSNQPYVCPDCGETAYLHRDGQERIDRALAAYDTAPESTPTPDLGSPADRAQDEQAGLPAWVLDLVRGLDRYEVEHPKLFRYIRPGVYEPWDCPAPLLALVPAEVRRLVELPAQVGASAEREG